MTKMKVIALVIIIITFRSCHSVKRQDLTIGGLFESDAGFTEQAFLYAADWVNEQHLLKHFNLVANPKRVDPFDSFQVANQVCTMMEESIAGVFGPRSEAISDHVQSLCDAMEIPHIGTRWDSRQRRDACLVNLYPHHSTMTKVFVDLVEVYEWESFTLLYENNDGLVRLNGLLTSLDRKGIFVTVRQLDEGPNPNYRPTLQKIRDAGQMNIVLDCSADILYRVLLHAQQVGLLVSSYSFIITTMDFQTIDWEPFMHAGTNITGIRLFDPESSELKEVMSFWSQKEEREIKAKDLPAEAAMMHDAVVLYAHAVSQLMNSHRVEPRALNCDLNLNWEHGYSIINFMKVTEVMGLTGLIKFDHEGFRTNFKLDIIQLTYDGIVKTGTWNTTNGVNFTLLFDDWEEEPKLSKFDLRNTTFRIMVSLVDPHVMLRETTETLEGNEKFEGMGIDVIQELSQMLGFNYTFREQKEGGSGGPINDTDKWSGMIGEVLANRADLAISDVTITEKREKVVDFTMPYMNLGISILYKKPSKTPSLWSFLLPFSTSVWICVLISYIGVSLLMYAITRISPEQWTNPYPCKDDDDLDELENEFNLVNAFWFTVGTLMQQGCDFGPVSFSGRVLAGFWSVFILIMVNSYTANLTACLTVEQNNDVIQSVEDLASQKPDAPFFVKYGAMVNGATEAFFKESNHSTYQKMWLYMRENYEDVMMKSNKDGVDRVLNTKEEYAFLMESASIDYEVERKCQLTQVGNPLDSKGYGIVMPKKVKYRNILSSSVIHLQEKGKFTQLYDKWWKQKRGGGACSKTRKSEQSVALDLDNVGGVFIVLVFGSAIGVFFTFGELAYEVYIKRDRGPFWTEAWKELKFALTSVDETKRLRPPSEENLTSEEELGNNGNSLHNDLA